VSTDHPPVNSTISRWLVFLVAAQGIAMVGLTLWSVVHNVTATSTNLGTAWALALLEVVWAALLLALAFGLHRQARWPRNPLVVTQLFLIVAVWPLLRSTTTPTQLLGATLLAWAVIILTGILLASRLKSYAR
jgi:hypothetical protein